MVANDDHATSPPRDRDNNNLKHTKEAPRDSGDDRKSSKVKEDSRKDKDTSKHRDRNQRDREPKDTDSASKSDKRGSDHRRDSHRSQDGDKRGSDHRSDRHRSSRGSDRHGSDSRNDRHKSGDSERHGSSHRSERHHSRDGGHRSRDRSRERERRHHDHDRRKRSRSRGRSKDRARSQSPSGSRDEKNKRTSGFDMAPTSIPSVPGMTLPGPLSGMSPTLPNILTGFPFAATQIAALSTMPMPAMTQQAMKHARRVYVGGLPPMATEQSIAIFFNQVMQIIGGNSIPGDSVVNVYINHEKKFAFVEMRTVEEASNAMALDGIIFEGMPVRVRRPSDYNPSLAVTLGPSQPNPHLNLAAVGLTPGITGGADGPDKIFVGGLPYYLTEAQIKELLQSFGPLRGFDLVKDRETGNSKGYAFCVYQDPAVTDAACAALNGLKMGDKTLTVRRATAGGQPKADQEQVLLQVQQQIAMQKLALQAGAYSLVTGLPTGVAGSGVPFMETPTKVICLTQLVSVDELMDDKEFEDIYQDIQDECSKYGNIATLVIPRPNSTGEDVPGLGKAFVEYEDVQGSSKAKAALNGRKFAGNTVMAEYYPEDKFGREELDG